MPQTPTMRLRGKQTFGNTATSNVNSTGTLDVASTANIQALNVAGATTLTGAIGAITGDATWRGTTTILSGTASIVVSASAVSSAVPPMVSLGRTTVASLRSMILSVDSVVAGTSFAIVSNLTTTDAAEIVWYSIQ